MATTMNNDSVFKPSNDPRLSQKSDDLGETLLFAVNADSLGRRLKKVEKQRAKEQQAQEAYQTSTNPINKISNEDSDRVKDTPTPDDEEDEQSEATQKERGDNSPPNWEHSPPDWRTLTPYRGKFDHWPKYQTPGWKPPPGEGSDGEETPLNRTPNGTPFFTIRDFQAGRIPFQCDQEPARERWPRINSAQLAKLELVRKNREANHISDQESSRASSRGYSDEDDKKLGDEEPPVAKFSKRKHKYYEEVEDSTDAEMLVILRQGGKNVRFIPESHYPIKDPKTSSNGYMKSRRIPSVSFAECSCNKKARGLSDQQKESNNTAPSLQLSISPNAATVLCLTTPFLLGVLACHLSMKIWK